MAGSPADRKPAGRSLAAVTGRLLPSARRCLGVWAALYLGSAPALPPFCALSRLALTARQRPT